MKVPFKLLMEAVSQDMSCDMQGYKYRTVMTEGRQRAFVSCLKYRNYFEDFYSIGCKAVYEQFLGESFYENIICISRL